MESTLIDLETRRAVRSYKPDMVGGELLAKIAEAGSFAPTGMGRQSPKIIVVRDRSVRDRLERLNAAYTGDPDGKPFYGAPVVMVVLADPEVGTCLEDGNLVMCNLLNAAHALGVASCYIYRARPVFDSPEGKALLREWGVDERYIGIGHCILGYAAAEPQPPKPRKTDYVTWIG